MCLRAPKMFHHIDVIELPHSSTIHRSLWPVQWACDNIPCECSFNLTYSVRDSAVHASVTLLNARSDQTEYGARDQELPAVYVNGFLYRLMAYTGDQPWTGQPLEEFQAGFDSFWVPGRISPTESFVAFAAADDFAVGVYNAAPEVSSFLAGFSGAKGSGGTSDAATGYMAPIAQLALPWDAVYTYNYVLAMGALADVRAYVYQLHASGDEAKAGGGSNG